MPVIQDARRMEYRGTSSGSITFNAPSGHSYSAGKIDPYIDAHPDDVEWLTARSFAVINFDNSGNVEDQAAQEAAAREHEENQRRALEVEAERVRLEQEARTNPGAFLEAADIGPRATQALLDAGITDADRIRSMSDEELIALDGVGTATVFKLRQAFPVQE